jgi:hypothetical protein
MASEPSAPNRVAAAKPGAKAWAAHRPGLTVPVDGEVGMGGADGGVKQLGAVRQVHQHGRSRR